MALPRYGELMPGPGAVTTAVAGDVRTAQPGAVRGSLGFARREKAAAHGGARDVAGEGARGGGASRNRRIIDGGSCRRPRIVGSHGAEPDLQGSGPAAGNFESGGSMNEQEIRDLFREMRDEPVPADSLARARMGVAERIGAERIGRKRWWVPLLAIAGCLIGAFLLLKPAKAPVPVQHPALPEVAQVRLP